MIRLVGPGGAGKSTIGALLAERLKVSFLDLDRRFADGLGDIGEYLGRYGYDAYARANVETYCSWVRAEANPEVDREVCVAETVRRQISRPFGRSASREEAVIRARFEIYMAIPY